MPLSENVTNSDNHEYFATKPIDEIGGEILARVEGYYQYVDSSGLGALWRRSYDNYYRYYTTGGGLVKGGEVGEYNNLYVNHYRNFLKHIHILTTSQRPYFEPRAINTDLKSQQQTYLAQGLLDYYLREKKLERYLNDATRNALIFGEGFVTATWDPQLGEDYLANPETGQTEKTGDLEYRAYTPLEVARDITLENSNESQWVVVRDLRNKFDLAARYPELKDRILDLSSEDVENISFLRGYAKSPNYVSDRIPQYTFYHKKSESMPNGRMVVFLDEDVVLFDGPLPYPNVPVYRIEAGSKVGDIFGDTVGFDLLPVQQSLDILHSTVMTNQGVFGVGSIYAQRGLAPSLTSLTQGLVLIEGDTPEPPVAVNFTGTPAEVFAYIDKLEQEMGTLAGINDVVRGNLPGQEKMSGTALALLQSTAIQFSMDLQRSYAQLSEDVGTATIKLLQTYANVPRLAAIAGKSNRDRMQSFTKDNLSEIDRVQVDLGNPAMRSTAGKVSMAEMLINAAQITDPQQLLEVWNTGKLEPMTEGPQASLELIREENEALSQGEEARALITDNHPLHILEHQTVGDSISSRKDPKVMAALTAHLQEHLDLLRNIDPVLAALLKMPAVGMPQPPQLPNNVDLGAGAEMLPGAPAANQAAKVQPPQPPNAPPTATPEVAAQMNAAAPPL